MKAALTTSETTDGSSILREVCSVNGISYECLPVEGRNLHKLEMFFSGMPCFVPLHHFSQLKELVIFSQTITQIEYLSGCPLLKKLWVCECEVNSLLGLEVAVNLKELYLYSNKIEKIENLDKLQLLERLWLNDNQIKVIENLNELNILRELNLSGNLIERLDNSLDRNTSVEHLLLSGNKIFSLKDLINLTHLPNLKQLGLKDPQYRPNPVCLLSNYSTFVLYHLPNLTRIDSFDVSTKHVKEVAENVVMKKKIFYFMKVRSIKRSTAQLINNITAAKSELLQEPNDRITALLRCRKELENYVTCKYFGFLHTLGDSIDTSDFSQSNIDFKLSKLKQQCSLWESGCQTVEKLYQEAVNHVMKLSDTLIKYQMLELDSGGNVRFEEGTPNQNWYKLCGELLASRFCKEEFQSAGVTGIKVNRIFRVHNSLRQATYDEVVGDELEKLSISTGMDVDRLSKKHQEFLFWCSHHSKLEPEQEMIRLLEEGFNSASYYGEVSDNDGIFLANSLNIVDAPRLSQLKSEESVDNYEDNSYFRVGRVLIVKVFVGSNIVPADEQPIRQTDYNHAKAAYRVHRSKNRTNKEAHVCDCTNRQVEWYIFNPQIVLPEYIIDFEYLTQSSPSTPFYSVIYRDSANDKTSFEPIIFKDAIDTPDVLHIDPIIPPKSPIGDVTRESVFRISLTSQYDDITFLNLMSQNITKLVPLSFLLNLKTLIISFNELTRLDDVSCLNLETIDASFNKLQTLDGLKTLAKLKSLDISWNKIRSSRESVSLLHKHTPNLTHLNVNHNPWQKKESLRLRIIGRLKHLIKLDEEPITESEAAAALRMAAGSRVSQVVLLTYSRTDLVRPKSLSLQPMSQTLQSTSRCRLNKSMDEPNWFLKITSLCLDNQHISKISNLERLENLKYASFCNNDITRIEGLDSCIQLEELSLEENSISKIENINHLVRLRKLYLANNCIYTLVQSSLEHLTNLEAITLENNEITSLRGIESCVSLLEIYLANNRVADSRDIFFLKSLCNLIILDLYGNSITNLSNHYRLSIIFHLKTLKALDGLPVEASESNLARELLGGKLTCDFLIEKQGHDRFYEIRELDFPNNSIRSVELTPSERFINLRSINLEHNNLVSFSGLVHLTNLRVLCLNHNNVESIFPKQKMNSNKWNGNPDSSVTNIKPKAPILEHLEVLHLGYNGIKDMAALELHRLPSLKALFLQGNEISAIEGLEGLADLREIVLDRNKIKTISETAFSGNWNLTELHVEENRIRDLSNLAPLEHITRIFFGSNRIQDFNELERLESLVYLIEISLVNNPISRRSLHRPLLIYKLPRLHIIDGIEINDEERERADLYFSEQQQQQTTIPMVNPLNSNNNGGIPNNDVVLPGIPSTYKGSVPVRVTNVNLGETMDPGLISWYENGQPSSAGPPPTVPTVSNTTANTNRLRPGGRLAPGPLQPPPQSRQIYYYDPSGHVEPMARWGYNKRK